MSLARYLIDKYFSKHDWGIPREEDLAPFIDLHKDKMVVVKNGDAVLGVAMFLTLSQATFERLHLIDIEDPKVLIELLGEEGPHIHFIIVTAEGFRVILAGIRAVIDKKAPETISWYDLNKKLNKYDLKGGRYEHRR